MTVEPIKTTWATVYPLQSTEWKIDKTLHRENGFHTVETSRGEKYYYYLGLLDRCCGLPAVEWPNGYRAYYRHGKRHRTDGPAIMKLNKDGSEDISFRQWWFNGKQLTEEELRKLVEQLNKGE